MRDVYEVLKEKTQKLIETRCLVESLKLVAPYLADDPAKPTEEAKPEVPKPKFELP